LPRAACSSTGRPLTSFAQELRWLRHPKAVVAPMSQQVTIIGNKDSAGSRSKRGEFSVVRVLDLPKSFRICSACVLPLRPKQAFESAPVHVRNTTEDNLSLVPRRVVPNEGEAILFDTAHYTYRAAAWVERGCNEDIRVKDETLHSQ
jgi:hypothetical protein